MKLTTVEKAIVRGPIQSPLRLPEGARRTPRATEQVTAALERQLAEFQQTFSVRWEW